MRRFHKRTFSGPCEFFREALFLLRHTAALISILRGKRLGPKFRERLFLAVTQVNECRACTWAHTRIALREGLTNEEVRALFQADLANTPEKEQEAVLYAQHWADCGGCADPVPRGSIEARFGVALLRDIELALRFIRFCNYSGNFAEYVVFLLTFGRAGGQKDARARREA